MRLSFNNSEIEYDNLLFCFLFGFRAYIGLFNGIIRSLVGNTASIDTAFVYLLLFLVVIKCIPRILHNFKFLDLLMMAIIIVMITFSTFYTSQDSSVTFSVIEEIVTKCIPLYIGGRLITPSDKLVKYLRITGYIMIIYVFWTIFIAQSSSATVSYDQFEGYLVYYGLCILTISAFVYKNKHDFIGIIAAFFIIFATGARGPLLFGVGIIIFYIVFTHAIDSKVLRTVVVLGIILIGILYYFFAASIFNVLLLRAGVNSTSSIRLLERLASGNFLEDNNRSIIIKCVVDYINNHYLIGTGVINDRVVLAKSISLKGGVAGTYAHNVFLEVCMQHGLIIGIILILLFAVWMIREYRHIDGTLDKYLYVSLAFCGLVPLLVSYSYLTFPWFYAFVGYLVNLFYQARSFDNLEYNIEKCE